MSERPPRPLPSVHQRPWAVGVYLAIASLMGLAWSAPVASAIAQVTGAYPRGDAEVFDPGAMMLLEALRRVLPGAGAIRASWLLTLILGSIFGLVALAFAIAQLSVPGKSRPSWALARALRSLPTLVLVSLVALLADVVVVLLLFLAAGALVRGLWPTPPPRDIARFANLVLVVLALLFVGVLHDLARVAVVMGPSRTYVALRASGRTFWRAPGRSVGAYAWRTALGMAAIAGAAWLGSRLGEKGAGAVLASAFVHQIGLAAAGWMRLSWLAAAARMVRPVLASVSDRTASVPPTEELSRSEPLVEGAEPLVEGAEPLVEGAEPAVEPSRSGVEGAALAVEPSRSEPLVEGAEPLVEGAELAVEPSRAAFLVERAEPLVEGTHAASAGSSDAPPAGETNRGNDPLA